MPASRLPHDLGRPHARRRGQLHDSWLPGRSSVVRRPRPARLRLVRGRLAALPRARGRDRGAAGSARRAPDRAPLGLPPRRAVARARRDRASRRVGGRDGGPISSASPATSSRIRAACRCSFELLRHASSGRFVVLGNHDVAVTRDPFSRAAELDGLEESRVLLRDEAVDRRAAGRRIQVVGVDAESYPRGTARPWELADPGADLRILLCHFPGIERTPPRAAPSTSCSRGTSTPARSSFPYPGGRVTLAHPRARVRRRALSRGRRRRCTSRRAPGTTFVPFRFFARPEVTELVLRSAAAAATIHLVEGHSLDLDGHPRELRGRCGARDRRCPRARRGSAAATPRASRSTTTDGVVAVELHLAVDWGANVPGGRWRRAGAGGRVPRADGRPDARRRST